MKRVRILSVLLLLALAVPLFAQDTKPIELTGEYNYARFNPTLPSLNNRSFNGGGVDFAYYFRPNIGVKADLQFNGSTAFTSSFPARATSAGFIPAGTYSANGAMKTYLFGPIAKARMRHFEPFGEILFGVAHMNAYANLSKVIATAPGSTLKVQGAQNPFAMEVGGGFDLPVSKVIAVRVAELDYLLTRLTNPLTSTNNQNSFRYSAGLQFRF